MDKGDFLTQPAARSGNDALAGRHVALVSACDFGAARVLKRLHRALQRGKSEQAQAALETLRSLYRIRDEALQFLSWCERATPPKPEERGDIPPSPRGPGLVQVYCVDSLALHQCHRYLTQKGRTGEDEPEWMLAVTGLRIGPFLTLEHWLEVTLRVQSPGHAAADMQDFTRLMVELDEFGSALHAILHSHRWPGPPRPSSVDLNLQRTLEEAGYPAIQGVFSEDGYIRFFACSQPFEVWVHGKGVEAHGRFLFHLNQGCSLRDPQP